ncbi:MAG: NUDIX domain-containing protein [Candidatus Pacearchaeota archaeon]|nr:NUDIX domain-containing protein [Candidatus Pacearchaeota archaeon]
MNVIIVNEKDEQIAVKERKNVKTEDIYRVSALWIKNSKEEFLLAQRAFTKANNPGKWGPAVAGTVEEGETYNSNIVKEAEEELGLKDIKPTKISKVRRRGEHNYFCQWFIFKTDKKIQDFKIQKEEVAEIKWFSKKEFGEKLKFNPDLFLKNMKRQVDLFN